jgi:competence protein ComEA
MFTMFKSLITAIAFAAAFCGSAMAADVNQANQAELEAVKGIGTAMSARILDERKKSAFKDWGDLIDRVKGLGPGNAARFSEAGLTVAGAAYKADAAKPTAKAGAKADAKAEPKAAAKP